MSRPEFITNEDITRWSDNIDNDPNISVGLAQSALIREVCYAGLWLCEQLEELNCPEELILRIQYTAGKLSFGRDAWEVHIKMLEDYKSDTLEYEIDSLELN